MDGLDLVVARHFDAIEPAELCAICAIVWQATETAASSALKFMKTLLARVPRFVEGEQLPNVLMPGVHCVKGPNWELKGKGHKMIERCIDHFGIDVVARAFPPGEERLLRGARKEFRRENRPGAPTGERDARPCIELDARASTRTFTTCSTRARRSPGRPTRRTRRGSNWTKREG
jgi:hypothetical protein